MNEFIKILLSLSVSGALLLLLIFGLKPLYKNKFSKRWQYYIWIVVALRFLLPFTPDTTIVGSLFEKFDTAAITNEIPANPNVSVPAGTGNNKAEPIQTNQEINTVAMREPFNKYVCLVFIWSVLALVLFVRFAVLSNYVPSSDLKRYVEKYYEDNNIARFAILLDCMTKEEKQEWLKRAQTDRKTNFIAVLSDELLN